MRSKAKSDIVVALFLLVGIVACGGPAPNADPQAPPANPRKEKTEAELKKLGVPINPWLPLIKSEEEARIRSPQEVARRTLVLHSVAAAGHGVNRDDIVKHLKEQGLWDHASPEEKRFLQDKNPAEQSMIDAAWRAEALWTLLWALGKMEDLGLPTEPCDEERIQEWVLTRSQAPEFISSARLRPVSEILDELDRIYRIHWAVRDAELKNQRIPANFIPSVVVERHYALYWLTGYADDWDDVPMDISAGPDAEQSLETSWAQRGGDSSMRHAVAVEKAEDNCG